MVNVTKSYSSYEAAHDVVDRLVSAGFPEDTISLISNQSSNDTSSGMSGTRSTTGAAPLTSGGMGTVSDAYHPAALTGETMGRDHLTHGEKAAADDAAVGATTGTVLGGGAGLLAGLGLMAIPGLGPVVAAGWLAATATAALAGAVAGGATGGIIGALTESGVSESDSHVYAESVRRGGAIVGVKVDESDRSRAEAIMNDRDPINPQTTGDEYRRGGWTGFDSSSAGGVPFNANPPVI